MKDSFDVVADVRSLINVPAITVLLTGQVYPDNRPGDSNKSDIVVNCFGVTNRWQQQGIVNVNVYVPVLEQSGNTDKITFRNIVKVLLPLLDHQNRSTFRTDVDDGGSFITDPDGKEFYNIPVNYYSIQEKFKNV
jgi:hypothetical protein